ncbi:MAG: proton extrusion protein PcxA [Nostocaceae cyanobacterium]|nr:proton extrusion protein PcxA [Nostocaceae cyanobacterium]
MNNSIFRQKMSHFLQAAYRWYLLTPERSLDEAYKAALQIKAIEDKHFNGNKISPDLAIYSSSVMDYFQSDLDKQLKTIKIRLKEFQVSRSVVAASIEKNREKLGLENIDSSLILQRLRYIDDIREKYTKSENYEETTQTNIPPQTIVQVESEILRDKRQKTSNRSLSNQKRGKTNTTGVLPRSIFNTISRLQIELDPNSEEDIVQNFRKSQRRTIISVRFILLLIIIPVLTHQLSKAFLIGPVVDKFGLLERLRGSEEEILFVNTEMQEEALFELQHFEEKITFEHLIRDAEPLLQEKLEAEMEAEAQKIARKYHKQSANAIKNVFADLLSVIALIIYLVLSKKEIAVIKDFFDNIVYGLSDSAKAFIIILFTDIFVGFHSPHGWEVILEGVSRHWGLPANHSFIFLFIATFPVILDTIFKYWIFRYLNRISPSAVATYHNMNE